MISSEPIDLATLESTVFKPLLNSEFTLKGEEETFPATLMEISEIPDNRPEDDRLRKKPFTLVFLCETAVLTQGIYALEHPELAPCNLFLSPFEGGEVWCKMEALFN